MYVRDKELSTGVGIMHIRRNSKGGERGGKMKRRRSKRKGGGESDKELKVRERERNEKQVGQHTKVKKRAQM